jgi:hypothetical protein
VTRPGGLRFVSRFGVLVAVGALFVLAATGSLFSSAPPVIAAQLLALGLSARARLDRRGPGDHHARASASASRSGVPTSSHSYAVTSTA